MSNKNVTLKEKVNGVVGDVLLPKTTTPNVYDAAKEQALSQTLVNTPDKAAVGYPAFSTLANYVMGDKVYYNNKVYIFTQNHSAGEWNALHVDDWSAKADIDAINAKIPEDASSENQLADKAYVDNGIATASATFRGTYNLVSDLELPVTATHAQVATALASEISTADKNDYAFVQIPTSAETPTEIASIDRYKNTGSAWSYEYSINNSGFTTAQWAAINSGITSSLVTAFGAKYDKPAGGIPASDMNTSTFDAEPTAGSDNLVKSGGVTKDFGLLERRILYSKTINLYDKDSIENRRGAYLDKSGIWNTLAGMLVTPFIPVIEGETYYISGWGTTVTMRFVTAYDAEYNVLPEKGADNTGTVNSYTCPSGVAFIRITTYKALNDVMICTTNGASYVPFEAISTKELYEGKLNKNAVINTFARSETDVLSSDANGLLIAKTANKKITRFSQVAANQIGSASFYTWGKDRFCGYVKQTDSYTYKIMIYQYDASKSLIGYGTIWPKSYTFDNAIPNAVYFKVQVLRRNADDTEDVTLSVTRTVIWMV